jgi:hypothetical protein
MGVHTTEPDALSRVGVMGQFLLGCALANLTFALIAAAACGPDRLAAAIRSTFARSTRNRLDVYLHVVAIGPILVILAAGPIGVHLFYHWVTPLMVGFAVWWGVIEPEPSSRPLDAEAVLRERAPSQREASKLIAKGFHLNPALRAA